jgi:hypothetical protein
MANCVQKPIRANKLQAMHTHGEQLAVCKMPPNFLHSFFAQIMPALILIGTAIGLVSFAGGGLLDKTV